MIPAVARILRIYVNANDRWRGQPLYRAIVETARALHLAGASVFNVDVSFGVHHRLHDAESEYASFEVPVVIEIVDADERVDTLLDALEPMMKEGLIIVGTVKVIRYTPAPDDQIVVAERAQPDASGIESPSRSTTAMRIQGKAQRLSVYIGSSDTWHGRNLAVAIVEGCRALGMAGATALRGVMGFGKHSVIHRAHLLGLSSDLPEKVEVVDEADQIEHLLPILDEMIGGGLIVIEDVEVVRYVHAPKTQES
jgi:PII-like signaling protein